MNKIDLKEESRVTIFGGMFDVAEGMQLTASAIAKLKTAALFYKHILALDGSLHAYGPAFAYLQQALAGKPRENVLGEFLGEDVLAPAIRHGDSIFDNWQGARDGAYPKVGLVLKLNEPWAERVLHYIDDKTHSDNGAYAPWPEHLAPEAGPQLGPLLWQLFGCEQSEHSFDRILGGKQATEATRLAKSVVELLDSEQSNPRFRRAQVEDVIASALGMERLSYPDVVTRAWTFPGDTKYQVAMHILDAVATVQQGWHAVSFGVVPGLFSRHNPMIVNSAFWALLQGGQTAATGAGIGISGQEPPLAEGAFDASRLTAREIVDIRKWDEFWVHIENLRRGRRPRPNESFVDANTEFVDHLLRIYLPKIVRKFPRVGWIALASKVTGATVAVVAVVKAATGITFVVGGIPILTFPTLLNVAAAVTFAATAVKASEPLDGAATWVRNKFLVWRTRQDYYRYWTQEADNADWPDSI